MKQEWGRPIAQQQPVKKASTIPEIVEELKAEVTKWGGTVLAKEEYVEGGKLKEVTLTIKFKVH